MTGMPQWAEDVFASFNDEPEKPCEGTRISGNGAEGGVYNKKNYINSTRTITSLNVFDFLATEFPPREAMLAPWLPVQGLAMVHAPRGLGKTHVALGAAWAISTGTGFLRWTAPKPRRVLLLDGEMPAVVLQERLQRIFNASDAEPPSPDYLTIAANDFQEFGLPDLSLPDAQKFYEPLVAAHDLVIVDNLSTLCRSLKETRPIAGRPCRIGP
jgi:hypothetical protein